MSVMSPVGGLDLRPQFVQQLESIAISREWELRWLSDYWVCELVSEGRIQRIVGGWFELNNSASVQLVTDKSATAGLFDSHGVACVAHELFRPQGRSASTCADQILARLDLPIVVKPNLGAAGEHVYRCGSKGMLIEALEVLIVRYSSLAVCRYLEIEDEVRCVVLDDRVLFSFRKVRADLVHGEWRHNLRFGSVPELLEGPKTSSLESLAREASRVARLRFATVDVVVIGGGHQVLEVNGSVRLEAFSAYSWTNWSLARDAFAEAIRLGFES